MWLAWATLDFYALVLCGARLALTRPRLAARLLLVSCIGATLSLAALGFIAEPQFLGQAIITTPLLVTSALLVLRLE
jgi:hypothetical protein